MRVVLDTNVLLSGLAYPQSLPGRIVAAWQHGSLEVVLSHCILNELARVLPKLTHRHGLNAQEMADLVDILAFQADLVEPDSSMEARLTDPMDQPVLNTWRAAQADYLLTGDKALLALGNEYPIITPAQFWQSHG
ncbi:DNA-binding protein [Sulfuriferula plumbiphila]|uniref:DNA-binding protein n=1 Tax=Sulfuriferula plumbiphila TaxID=171865 RepID=A0A512L8C0_9PROT|nr:putative toxin-antitoxin system toxin component, PIN family [Sulfuriferula plumbiphila]BBP05354.1 DNA-binding protein [Sulfuriferula plumbiphila]GEP30391.1 DNA-binding protein [Sulfuriferula plumbiphila]